MRLFKFLLIFFHLLFILSSSLSASPFSDLPQNHWAKDAVETLASKGFVSGFSHDVFDGTRPATRYQTAAILVRALAFLENKQGAISPSQLQLLKDKLADYSDEIDRLGLQLETLETKTADLESRISQIERLHASGEFHNRTLATQINGALGTGAAQDTSFALASLDRPYPLFPIHAGQNLTSTGVIDLSSNFSQGWIGGGRIAAYNSVGDSLNGLVFGNTPPLFSNPFLGYTTNNNLKGSLDRVYVKTEENRLVGEIGSIAPEHSPAYLYSGVPNLTIDGQPFLPNFGGRLEANLKPILFITKAYSEFFAGKLGQGTSWETETYGANAGIELLGVAVNLHWMTAQNDPSNFAAGTSGMIPVPINNSAGWLDPVLLTPIAVGPQKERLWGIDLSVNRKFADHPVTFKIAYGRSDYKPNTNSSNNAGGQLYDLSVQGELSDHMTAGAEYLSVDPKYSPFILPVSLPSALSFSWGQWPFPVDFQGYFTLQNAQLYPQNREGAKLFATWKNPRVEITGSVRFLSQKVATQLSSFNNDTDIQSIGFFEPFFTATGARPRTFPNGTTRDWVIQAHYTISDPLTFELGGSGVAAKRWSGDANDVDFTGWLGTAGLVYNFWQKWKLNVAYHVAHTDGFLLSAPSGPSNVMLRNTGKTVRLDYILNEKADAFFVFRNLDHTQVPSTLNFHMLQFLTGIDTWF